VLAAILAFYACVALLLIALRWVDPPFTAVQAERRVSAFAAHSPYRKRYTFVALDQISPHLQHAVLAAEDERFFRHHGFDWKEIGNAAVEDWEDGRRRGASTITQQLVRNLFLSTGRSVVRKAVEFSIVPLTEGILSKRRILELYLNVIEWGPGVYGAEAASEYCQIARCRGSCSSQNRSLGATRPPS
jgi:monofunctional biosynthetic peptidoglycan transglycosylase